MTRTSAANGFGHVETWVFDLDNTLYPADCNLFAQIDRRMGAFIAEQLGLPLDEAHALRQRYYAEHGTYVNASFTDGAQVTNGSVLDVSDNDLLGRYFSSVCYTFDGAPTANAYSIECDGGAVGNTAPYATEVATIVRLIDQNGSVTNG